MPKPKFEVIIYWSEEDEVFIAEVPELPGCIADGKTHRDALRNVEGITRTETLIAFRQYSNFDLAAMFDLE